MKKTKPTFFKKPIIFRHVIYIHIFSESINAITTKTDDRINILNENLHQYKNHYTLPSPTLRTALDQIPENFAAVSIAKATNNVTLICKRFLPRAKDLGLGNNDKTSTYKEINNLSFNQIVNKHISYFSCKFGIEDVPINNHWLPDIYWVPKMHKTLLNPNLL